MISLKNIRIKNTDTVNKKIEALVVGVFENSDINNNLKILDKEDKSSVLSACTIESFKGKRGEHLLIYGRKRIKRIFLYGLGNSKKINSDSLRSESARIFHFINNEKITTLSILSSSFKLNKKEYLQAIKELKIVKS